LDQVLDYESKNTNGQDRTSGRNEPDLILVSHSFTSTNVGSKKPGLSGFLSCRI